ncbi:hypothetical protein AAE478_006042 [Parahypoxylon ruwenzoriense]
MSPPPPGLFVPAKPSDMADEADDISLISTDQEADATDQDKHWFVDELYAERDHPDRPGEKQYLIKWDGFPMDQCTWEPVENLGPGLRDEWEGTKEDIKAGRRQPFDLEIYNAACRTRTERHMRRNAKRKRLGLPLTEPFPLESPIDDSLLVSVGDELDSGTKPKRQDDIKQKIVDTVALEKPKAKIGVAQHVNKRKSSKPSPPLPSPKPSQPGVSTAKSTGSGNGAARTGTMTGYQGTARNPNATASPASSKHAAGKARKPSHPLSKASSSGPAQLPKISTSLASKFAGKRLTATRTRPQQAAPHPQRTSNIFIGGKERKKRPGLSDAMTDPSRAPKAFQSLRVMNIAKKRGIEKNDAAPYDFSSIPASFLLTNNGERSPSANKIKTNAPSAPLEPHPIVQSPIAMSSTDVSTVVPVPSTKKKSVRFTRAEEIVPEDVPMAGTIDGDDGRAAGGQDCVSHPAMNLGPPKKAATGPRKLSLASYQESRQTQVVSKMAVFGKSGSDPVKVLFNGITRQSQPWLATFISLTTLHFGTICAAYNFIVQRLDLVGDIFSNGTVEPTSAEALSALTNIAEHLRRGAYGSHLVAEGFSILVYPSACDSWKGLGVDVDKNNPESPLRYVIYRSRIDRRLYPTSSVPRAPAHLNSMEHGLHCRILLKELFDMNFSQILPQEPKKKNHQLFMLLFPERETQVCNVIKLWLRSCQPNCRIFSCELKDSWIKFHEAVRAGAAGTIILHEDMTTAIRKIPRISEIIDNKRCYTIWNLATGQYEPPRFPSDIYAPIEPGTLQMTRLFPLGRVFMITPSFALSDPARLCEFLEWFRGYCVNIRYLIVACADFPNYLKAITLEKEKEHQAMCLSHKDDPKLEEMLGEIGLRKSDLEARFRAWKLLNDIIKQFGSEETSEDIRKVEWITDFIDPNDEQSLVNWFCWWSTTKCDRYRKFTVLGSSVSRNKAAYRHIEIPAYTEETVSDPVVALAHVDRQRRAREAVEGIESTKELGQSPIAISGSANTGSTPTTSISRPPSDFRSNILKADRAADLASWTANFVRSRITGWARLHVNPVSWLDVSMADHFGDPRCKFNTFKNWLGSAPKFIGRLNTWYGLFYTIDREWNPAVPAKAYERHPWIAIFRPVEPHLTSPSYERMELFIWDLSARDREQARGHSSLLLDMQRHLIDVVKEETPVKDQRHYLDRVYIGSRTKLRFKPDDNLLDITCRRIEEMTEDGKYWLPPFENLLTERGWLCLQKSEWQGGMAAKPADQWSAEQQHTRFPRHARDEDKPQRSIWHAPRPKIKGDKSRCVNDLYEAAFRARMKNESCQSMKYQYRPTLEWYHDMKEEGRDSSHVKVDSGDKILFKLRQKKQ